jgi:hypothetical protein
VYRDERKVIKKAPVVLLNEHNRITDPLILISLSILVFKEETNNITYCLKNFRNIDRLLQIIRIKIVHLSSYLLYWKNRLITSDNISINSFDKIQYYIDFNMWGHSKRNIKIPNTCNRAFDDGSKFLLN